MSEEKRTPEKLKEEVEQMRTELRLYGFAIVKHIAECSGLNAGIIACPLCQKSLKYVRAPSNGHVSARCETEDCIHAVE